MKSDKDTQYFIAINDAIEVIKIQRNYIKELEKDIEVLNDRINELLTKKPCVTKNKFEWHDRHTVFKGD